VSLGQHLTSACIGSISEIFDAEPHYTSRGCCAQAWSVAEVIRVATAMESTLRDQKSDTSTLSSRMEAMRGPNTVRTEIELFVDECSSGKIEGALATNAGPSQHWIERSATMTIEKRDVMFKSGETFAAAWFFLPKGAAPSAPVPAVVMAHGFGAVKEMYLEPFARRFATAGIAALVFDYCGFGASGGEPRQRVLPPEQMEDYRNALTWLSLQPEVDADRLGIWGTSFSGAHVIQVAAHDSRVKAVVSQAGPMDLGQILLGIAGPEQFAAMQKMAIKERIRYATEGGEHYVPSTGRPGEGYVPSHRGLPDQQRNREYEALAGTARARYCSDHRGRVYARG